ncbi:MAG: 6-bladed beta-propeller [Bacteroidetes bacterium]|nr:6-bladed beta-propeller [Bacteroidota bacterium]
MRYFILLFLILLSHSLWSQKFITLRLDPDNSRGGTASQVFDSIRFIPLETTKESLFGAIDQMEVTDSLFVILDIRGHSILLFDRSGKFYTRITTGGGEKYFYYFSIDRSKNEIVATNNYANGLLVYDLRGRFLRKEKCPDNIASFYHFSGNSVLYNLRRKGTYESSDHILYDLCYSHGYDSVVKNLKPYNARNEANEYNISSNPFNFSGEAGSCMFSMPFEYSIYQLADTGVICKYQFVFPLLHSLPLNFATDGAYRSLRGKFAYNTPGNESMITALERGCRFGDYMLFSAISRQSTFSADFNMAYNLHTSSLISFSRVTGDSSSSYFPILSTQLERVDAIYDGKIFSSSPGFRLFAIKNSLDKKVEYPESLQKYFTNGKKTDNAVIVQFKLKPGL